MHDSQGALRGRDAGRIWRDGSRAVGSASAERERPLCCPALLGYLTRTDESVGRFQQEFQSGGLKTSCGFLKTRPLLYYVLTPTDNGVDFAP